MLPVSEYKQTHDLDCAIEIIDVMVRDGRVYTLLHDGSRVIDLGTVEENRENLIELHQS